MIKTKRVYDPPESTDGLRILVDRLWPRGVSKDDLAMDDWIKEVAPSNDLRRWFGHKPERWEQFLARYFKELEDNQAQLEPLLKLSRTQSVTLLYAAKDTEHNNAEAIKLYLNSRKTSSSRNHD